VASPDEGLELIHDFFVDAWDGIQLRYDDSKSAFTTYLFAAFVKFARPKIVASRKWRDMLLPPMEIEKALESAATLSSPDWDKTLDLQAVRRAFNRLTPEYQLILRCRLESERSERQAARDLRLSRYHLRLACGKALAKLCIEMNEPGMMPSHDWALAKCLWSDERSISEVAETFGMGVAEVRSSRQRVLQILSLSISRSHLDPKSRNTKVNTPYCAIWKSLIENPSDPQVVAKAKMCREALLDHLYRSVHECEDCTERSETVDEERWVAIYDVLGEQPKLSKLEAEVLDKTLKASSQDRIAVASAVSEVLLPSLPRELRELSSLGATVEPITIFQTTDAVSLLVHRILSEDKEDVPFSIMLKREGTLTFSSERRTFEVPNEVVLEQIAYMAKVEAETSTRLAEWVWMAARSHPRLFVGLESSPRGANLVRLVPESRGAAVDLFERWQQTS